jgi:hypothetical protein
METRKKTGLEKYSSLLNTLTKALDDRLNLRVGLTTARTNDADKNIRQNPGYPAFL